MQKVMSKIDKGQTKHSRSEKLILYVGLISFFAFFSLQAAARSLPGFGEWYAVNIYPLLQGTVGLFFGFFSFSCAELLLYFMVIFCCIYGFCHWKQWRKVVRGTFSLISVLLLVFTMNCGINYYRTPFSYYLNYNIRKYSTDELEELMMELTKQVNRTEYLSEEGEIDFGRECVVAMGKLGDTYGELAGFYPQPKKLLFSRLLSVQQLAGIYSPFTIEANYNGEMTAYNIPHTACHELSHLKGFMREDEANFIGFLACIGSDSAKLQYSGYLTAWIYAGNALAAEDMNRYYKYWEELSENTKEQLVENSLFWDRFDTKTAEISETFNDAYLKANSQPEGVKSYGRVVDLILAWYHQ